MAPGPAHNLGFERMLRQAGIEQDKPLYAVLAAVHEAAEAARVAASNAHGLGDEVEASLIQRVSDAAGKGARDGLFRISLWTAAKLGLGFFLSWLLGVTMGFGLAIMGGF